MLTCINEAEVLDRLNHNTKLLSKLLNTFYKKYNTIEPELLHLLETKDYANAQLLVHTIKGVAGNLSMPQLYLHASDLEESIKTSDNTRLSINTQKFLHCMVNTQNELRTSGLLDINQ